MNSVQDFWRKASALVLALAAVLVLPLAGWWQAEETSSGVIIWPMMLGCESFTLEGELLIPYRVIGQTT
jgi:hypothetical protein